jgi:hypothetical protein
MRSHKCRDWQKLVAAFALNKKPPPFDKAEPAAASYRLFTNGDREEEEEGGHIILNGSALKSDH